MKKLLSITFLYLFVFCASTFGQGSATATMRVTATIVSGVTLNSVDVIDINLEDGVQASNELKFTTPEYLDSEIEITDEIIAQNEFGDEIEISSTSMHQNNGGRHTINLKTRVTPTNNSDLKGVYKGSITTTINYL